MKMLFLCQIEYVLSISDDKLELFIIFQKFENDKILSSRQTFLTNMLPEIEYAMLIAKIFSEFWAFHRRSS